MAGGSLMNRFTGIGRLVRDPELKYSQQGVAVCKFTIAIKRRFKKDETDFIDVVTFKALAENCANYLSKGKMAAVSGELHIGSYTNKEGQKVKTVDVTADEVEFLSPKNDAGTGTNWDDIATTTSDDEIPF
jgi:single-strand DNA-binding protein